MQDVTILHTRRSAMNVNCRIELRASLVQINDGFDGERARALGAVEGEIPALAAGAPALEPEGAAEQHPQSTVRAHLREGALLPQTPTAPVSVSKSITNMLSDWAVNLN